MACSQLSPAPEQAEQNSGLTLGNEVSGQIVSSLAEITDVEDNLFLLVDSSLLIRICENRCKDSLLHQDFTQKEMTQDNAII